LSLEIDWRVAGWLGPVPTQSALLKFFDKRAEVRLLVPAKKRVASCQADPLPPTPLGLVARPPGGSPARAEGSKQHLCSIRVRPSALAVLSLMANSNLVEARQAGQRPTNFGHSAARVALGSTNASEEARHLRFQVARSRVQALSPSSDLVRGRDVRAGARLPVRLADVLRALGDRPPAANID
jgi:hypothetical protein